MTHRRPISASSIASFRARTPAARRSCCCTAPAATSTTCSRSPSGSRPATRCVSPRGKVNEDGITRFFRRAPDGAWDLDDLKLRTGELADFLRSARGAYGLPKPIALGYSNGANIGWSLLLKEPDALAGAILLRAMLPFDPRPLPDLSGIPVLLIAAHDDELIPVERAGPAGGAARRGRRRRDL